MTNRDNGYALLLDPEQLGDGIHEINARIIRKGAQARSLPATSPSRRLPPRPADCRAQLGFDRAVADRQRGVVYLFLRVTPAAELAPHC